jgi:hypothetical protein
LAGIELLPQSPFFNAVFNVQALSIALGVWWHGPQSDHGDGNHKGHLQHQPHGPRVEVKVGYADIGRVDMGIHRIYLTKIEAVIWTKGCSALLGAWPKLGTSPVCKGLIVRETGVFEAYRGTSLLSVTGASPANADAT